jgi:hypothetical protein
MGWNKARWGFGRVFKGRFLLLLLLNGLAFAADAQSWDEWFNQASTQVKYYVQQIAALKAYGGAIASGRVIVRSGLDTIGAEGLREKQLHKNYYSSLDRVNAVVREDPAVQEITAGAAGVSGYAHLLEGLKGLTAGELAYLRSVAKEVMVSSGKDMAELQLLLTDDRLSLTDQERISRLHGLEAGMVERYRFVRDFYERVRALLMQRQGEGRETKTLIGIYGTGD